MEFYAGLIVLFLALTTASDWLRWWLDKKGGNTVKDMVEAGKQMGDEMLAKRAAGEVPLALRNEQHRLINDQHRLLVAKLWIETHALNSQLPADDRLHIEKPV